MTEHGEPVEFFLEPGAFSNTSTLGLYNFDLPQGSFVPGDKAYNDYTIEDVMRQAGVELIPLRKKLASSSPYLHDLLPSLYSQDH